VSILERLDQVQDLKGRLTAVAPVPRSVKLETTTLCNHACSYCSRQYREREHGTMSWEFYLRILDEMKEAGVQQVGLFFLGEPFLIKNIHEWVREAKQRGFFVFLTTNGTAPTPDRIEAVMKAGLDSLKFSCNYYDAEQFSNLARVSPKLFWRIYHNIAEARKIRDFHGYKCELSGSTIMYSGKEDENMKEYMEKVGKFLDVTYTNTFYAMSVNAGEIEKETGYKPNAGNPGRLRFIDGEWQGIREPVPCWSAWEGHLGMGDWDESIKDYRYHLSACCFDGSGEFNMGDLNGPDGMSFMDAWNSEKFVELRQKHIEKNVRGTVCHECIYGKEQQ
jgi:MoaA/NifB/PqqE/SkfB family radical SAM enzyme